MPEVSLTRATLRSAEFGFLGVVVYTRVHTPRRWGLPFSAGVLVLPVFAWRPLRTSCWIVGTGYLRSLFLIRDVSVAKLRLGQGRVCGPNCCDRQAITRLPTPAVGRVVRHTGPGGSNSRAVGICPLSRCTPGHDTCVEWLGIVHARGAQACLGTREKST